MMAFITRHKTELQKALAGLLGLGGIFLLWSILSASYHPLIFPSPREAWQALGDLWEEGSLVPSIAITLHRTLYGYGLALLIGFSLAAFSRIGAFWQALLKPVLAVVQIIPPVVWTILAVIWFGISGGGAPVFLIFIVTLPLAFSQAAAGLEGIDRRLVEMSQVYRCRKSRVLRDIYLPALVPHLAATLGVGFSFAWKAAIFAEFMGSTSGVGFLLSTANSNLDTERVFAWVVVLAVLMLICEYGLLIPLRRRAARWCS